jgi:hypothetical protein
MYTVSITVDDVINALGNFITPLCPGSTIVRAQVNRVPIPPSPFVMLRELYQEDFGTPVVNYVSQELGETITTSTKVTVQIDFYGQNAGDQCRAVKNAFRTEWATSQFPDGIKPLYIDEAMQIQLITGEVQYERRWMIKCALQYNPSLSVPQDSANALSTNTITNIP